MKILPWILFAVTAVLLGLTVMATRHNGELLSSAVGHETNAMALIEKQSIEISNLQAQLAHANQVAALKSLPVKITTRKALTGPGKVADIQNEGDEALRLTILLHNAGNESSKTELVLDPHSTKEIGHLEGWAFVTGDELSLSCPGYKNAKWKCN